MDGASAIGLSTGEDGQAEFSGRGAAVFTPLFVSQRCAGPDNIKPVDNSPVKMAFGPNERPE